MKKGEPFYMPVPRDLKKVKTKIVFNLTKRQLICFSVAAIIGFPVYLLSRNILGTDIAMFAMFFAISPFFLLAMYEKDGMPAEVYFKHVFNILFKNSKERPYKTYNYYTALMRQIQLNEEVEKIVFSKKEKRRKGRTKTSKKFKK